MFKQIWLCLISSCTIITAGCNLPQQNIGYQYIPTVVSVYPSKNPQAHNYTLYANHNYRLPYFSRLVVSDNIATSVNNGTPTLYFAESPPVGSQMGKSIKEHANVEVTLIGTTLYLEKYNPAVYYDPKNPNHHSESDHKIPMLSPVMLHAPSLKMIMAREKAHVIVSNLTTNNLQVYALNSASIILNGDLHITNLVQKSSNRIEAKWLDGERLEVISYASGPIFLAGEIKNLSVTLGSNAHLDARYLRAKNAAVFVTDTASASIYAKNILNAFADNHSNIYYYKRPLFLNKVTKNSGNVLFLESLP